MLLTSSRPPQRTRHRQSAFTYLLSRGAEGGKLADIAAAIVANSGAEDEAKERKRVSTYLGNQLREDEVFVPMGGAMYALRAFFSEQDRARYMERAEVEVRDGKGAFVCVRVCGREGSV